MLLLLLLLLLLMLMPPGAQHRVAANIGMLPAAASDRHAACSCRLVHGPQSVARSHTSGPLIRSARSEATARLRARTSRRRVAQGR